MIIGEYKIIRTISEGSFGKTFLAQHQILKLPVCIKQEITGDPRFQEWFREEAKLLWNLGHPGLPTIKAYYEEQKMIVMSFVPGDNLQEIVEKNGFVDDEHLCWILQRCLDALGYLHYKGIVHCDIKPQNIILDIPEHNATIIDFGVSVRSSSCNTKPKGSTEFYMPPEFERGLPPVPASDIFSLGKVGIYLSGGHVGNGNCRNDMRPELKNLLSCMTKYDVNSRYQQTSEINEEILRIRKFVWGRTSTEEMIKFLCP